MSCQATKLIPLVEPWIPASYAEAVKQQILSGFIGPGPATQEFALALAAYVGAPHCFLTVSGTVALSVAARAIGLKPGDEILVPAYGVISTINAFSSMGLCPTLVDIDRVSGCMSPEHLEQTLSSATRAVCFVNFSGYTGSNLVAIKRICDREKIPLIEDAACALGHRHEGVFAGLFGTVGTYSFSTPKILTTGQGGAVVTSDIDLFNKGAAFIDQGDLEWRKTNFNREIGSNLRFNDLLAAFGLCQLKDLSSRLERRRNNYEKLKLHLKEALYSVPGLEAPLHHIVFAAYPERLRERLRDQGIATARPYRTLSQHPAYQQLAKRSYSNADFWTNHAVYLPFGVSLTPEDCDMIAQAVCTAEVELIR